MSRGTAFAIATLLAAAGLGGLAALPAFAVVILVAAGIVALVGWRLPKSSPPEVRAAEVPDTASKWLRPALVEALDNCRAWSSRDPARGEQAARNIEGAEPRLAALSTLVDNVDLPADLTAYLMWMISTIGDHWGRIEASLPSFLESDGVGRASLSAAAASRLGDDWRAMVERLQVVAALIAAEARRRGLNDVARTHDIVPWTVVPRRPDRWRELMALSDRMREIPRFPADPAFASASPEARDLAGQATGARQEAALSQALHAGVERVLHRS